MAVSHELGLPILRVGVGEGIEDLQPFDAREYAEALFGEMRAELDGDEEGGDLSTSVSDDTSGRDDMPEPEEAPSVISSEEPEATPSVISSEESEANEVEKSQPSSSPGRWRSLRAPVSDDTSGQDDMLETEKTSMTADEWFAETESEPEEQESFRDKMRRWFS